MLKSLQVGLLRINALCNGHIKTLIQQQAGFGAVVMHTMTRFNDKISRLVLF